MKSFAAFLYLTALRIKEMLYKLDILKLRTLPCKVISVGNLTAGGTGKTPIVEYVVKYLSRTKKVAILTRGYKRENRAALLDVKPESSPKECGDEAVYLARETNVPVIAAVNRYNGGKYAVDKYKTQFCVLDDGFQRRWSLYRNMEILVIDASNPFGNGKLLPAGILREPVDNIRAAGSIILTKVDDAENIDALRETIQSLNAAVRISEAVYEPKELYNIFNRDEKAVLSDMAGKKILALSAVGNPKYFRKVISKLKPAGINRLSYADHYVFTEEDITKINEYSRMSDIIVTTEKDAIKLGLLNKTKFIKKLLALRVELSFIKGEKALQDQINIT